MTLAIRHAEGFYLRCGAQRIGAVPANMDETKRSLPLLVVNLARGRR